jgi:hypothetical protein
MGTTRYIIEDDFVKAEDIERMPDGTIIIRPAGICSISSFVQGLALMSNHTLFLPRLKTSYVIAEAKFAHMSIYIMEQKPSTLSITERIDSYIQGVHGRVNPPPQKEWVIAVPYVYYAVTLNNGEFDNLRVFFNKKPVERPSEKLGQCPLPNQYTDDTVCTGDELDNQLEGVTEVSTILDRVVQNFWTTTFNMDLTQHWVRAKAQVPGFPQSFKAWHDLSANAFTRNNILTFNWVESGRTLESLLAGIQHPKEES